MGFLQAQISGRFAEPATLPKGSQVVISGRVNVGEYCFLGVNATIRNAITIAPETLVGAGSIIMTDTEPKSVYVPERTAVFKKTSDKIKL